MRPTTLVSFVLSASVVLAACTRPVRPDDMSAEAHRRQAVRERHAAAKHAQKFDPEAEARVIEGPRDHEAAVTGGQLLTDYNPTVFNLVDAAKHEAHAREHERAAAALEAFEDAECRAIAPAVRAACPFIGPIRSVEEIDAGVRLHLAPGAPVSTVATHLRCHFAFARTRAFAVSDCPLTLRATEVAVSTDGTAIEITSLDRKIIRELQQRATRLLPAAF